MWISLKSHDAGGRLESPQFVKKDRISFPAQSLLQTPESTIKILFLVTL